MSRSMISRSVAIALTVVVVVAFTFVTGETAHAAAKKKTVWLVTSEKDIYSNDGAMDKYSIKHTYDKHGLLVKTIMVNPDGSKTKSIVKRNKKGAVKKVEYYTKKKLTELRKNTLNKKGLVTKSKFYDIKSGKKVLVSVINNAYYKNGKLKKTVHESKKEPIYTYTSYYRKNGTLKKTVSRNEYGGGDYSQTVTTYDKKEREVKSEEIFVMGEYTTTGKSTFKHKQNKHGDVTKTVKETVNVTQPGGGTTTPITTTTYKYKYDKHGNILKKKSRQVYVDGDQKLVNTNEENFKYKKMKVDKKYLKYIED